MLYGASVKCNSCLYIASENAAQFKLYTYILSVNIWLLCDWLAEQSSSSLKNYLRENEAPIFESEAGAPLVLFPASCSTCEQSLYKVRERRTRNSVITLRAAKFGDVNSRKPSGFDRAHVNAPRHTLLTTVQYSPLSFQRLRMRTSSRTLPADIYRQSMVF